MISYDLFGEVAQLRDIFDDFFKTAPSGRTNDYPSIEIFEKDDKLEVRGLVPGVKASELNVQLVDNSLILEGVKNANYADSPYIRKERSFGRFKKSVKLPYRVDASSISAELKDGILCIRLAKSDDAKPKKIEVR